jgi:hypothetical protein
MDPGSTRTADPTVSTPDGCSLMPGMTMVGPFSPTCSRVDPGPADSRSAAGATASTRPTLRGCVVTLLRSYAVADGQFDPEIARGLSRIAKTHKHGSSRPRCVVLRTKSLSTNTFSPPRLHPSFRENQAKSCRQTDNSRSTSMRCLPNRATRKRFCHSVGNGSQ